MAKMPVVEFRVIMSKLQPKAEENYGRAVFELFNEILEQDEIYRLNNLMRIPKDKHIICKQVHETAMLFCHLGLIYSFLHHLKHKSELHPFLKEYLKEFGIDESIVEWRNE